MATRIYPYVKTAAPTVNDDTGDGYKVGDTWLDTTNDKIYQAIDVTAGAAVWHLYGSSVLASLAAASANGVSLITAANYAAMKALLDLEIGTDVQAWDADLDYLAGFTPTANVKSILNAADYAAIKTLLSLTIGTNVQAWDADLDYLAGFTPTANVKSVLNAADYAAIRTLLGLVIGTNVQAYDADLTTWASLTPSAFFQTLIDDADAAALRTTIGAGTGNGTLTSSNIVATITNGVTTNAPSEDAVFDALALKAPLASPTFTGTVILPKTIEIQDTSADHQYVLAVSELAADRTITLPLLAAADTFVFAAFIQTLTNKRITPRLTSETSSATPTINTDNTDIHSITALAAAITSFTTNLSGTPTEGQKLIIQITDDGTARALTFGSSFASTTVTLPTTTVISTRLRIGFMWNAVTSKWDCVAKA